jgi:hypothetical protein
VPVCVELEGTEEGWWAPHLNQRVFNGEIGTAHVIAAHRWTRISDAVMIDAGYHVRSGEWSKVQDWGRHFGGPEKAGTGFDDFFEVAPGAGWPENYVARTTEAADSPRCTFDLGGVGEAATKYRLSELPLHHWAVRHGRWSDPTGTDRAGHSAFDYALVPWPAVYCDDAGIKTQTSWTAGPNSACALSNLSLVGVGGQPELLPGCFEMRCDEKKNVHVKVGGVEQKCVGAALAWSEFDGILQCPDASILCGVRSWRSRTWIWVGLPAAAAAIAAFVGVCIVWQKKGKNVAPVSKQL